MDQKPQHKIRYTEPERKEIREYLKIGLNIKKPCVIWKACVSKGKDEYMCTYVCMSVCLSFIIFLRQAGYFDHGD